MTARIYIKDESFDPIFKQRNSSFVLKSRILPLGSILLGIAIIATQIVVPLVFFETSENISKPVRSTVLGIASGFGDFSFKELSDSDAPTQENTNVPDTFYLSIPKLKIDRAVVETNSESLSPDDVVGHYIGSALPDAPGNMFLYGHSVLPVFYNPKNYKTIFSTLNKLGADDVITVEYNNKKYTYQVDSVEILKTSDVKPLEKIGPEYLNKSTITIMTCWPPGTKSKRLQVVGTQINPTF